MHCFPGVGTFLHSFSVKLLKVDGCHTIIQFKVSSTARGFTDVKFSVSSWVMGEGQREKKVNLKVKVRKCDCKAK